jgi:hypothetical protein
MVASGYCCANPAALETRRFHTMSSILIRHNAGRDAAGFAAKAKHDRSAMEHLWAQKH